MKPHGHDMKRVWQQIAVCHHHLGNPRCAIAAAKKLKKLWISEGRSPPGAGVLLEWLEGLTSRDDNVSKKISNALRSNTVNRACERKHSQKEITFMENDHNTEQKDIWLSKLKKLLAPLSVVIILILKFGAKLKFLALPLIKFFPILLKTGGTMILSIWAYSMLWGWQFAAGFVLLVFVHESGHLIAAKTFSLNVGWPVFIPFMGAVIALKEAPPHAWVEFWVAAGGPIAGGLAAFGCHYRVLALYSVFNSRDSLFCPIIMAWIRTICQRSVLHASNATRTKRQYPDCPIYCQTHRPDVHG